MPIIKDITDFVLAKCSFKTTTISRVEQVYHLNQELQ